MYNATTGQKQSTGWPPRFVRLSSRETPASSSTSASIATGKARRPCPLRHAPSCWTAIYWRATSASILLWIAPWLIYAEGDKPHALDDYNTAVKLAPKKAQPYFYRGVFYAVQTEVDTAMRDFDTALSIDPKLVAALRQRAIIYVTQKNFSGALADFSEALRLRPKTAALWSERGYVSLLQRDYAKCVKGRGRSDPTRSEAGSRLLPSWCRLRRSWQLTRCGQRH